MRRAVIVSAWVVFATLAAWVAIEGALPYDRRALAWVHDLLGTSVDDPARVMARTATASVLAPLAVIVAAVLAVRRRWDGLLLLLAAAVLVWIVNPGLKRVVRRERPTVRGFVEPVSEFSFPSGHASAAMAAAVVAVVLSHKTRWRTTVLAGAIVYVGVIVSTQLALGRHFPSDLVASVALVFAVLATGVGAWSYWRAPGATTPDS